MSIELHLLDGVEFVCPDYAVSLICFPEHAHKDTGLKIPQIYKINTQIGQFSITKESFDLLKDYFGNRIGVAGSFQITVIEELPEWILCGYATREELDAKKEEILKQEMNKKEETRRFLDAKRKERKAQKEKKALKAKKK